MPGKITNITDRFGDFTCDTFKKHGFRQVGYWLNRMGGNDHQLIYLLAWESLDERVAKFDTFAKDPERPRVRREREERPHRAAGGQHDAASHGLLPDEVRRTQARARPPVRRAAA